MRFRTNSQVHGEISIPGAFGEVRQAMNIRDVQSYIKMSQFRNRIVHLYNHIDTKTLYDILVNEFEDIKDFYIGLLHLMNKK